MTFHSFDSSGDSIQQSKESQLDNALMSELNIEDFQVLTTDQMTNSSDNANLGLPEVEIVDFFDTTVKKEIVSSHTCLESFNSQSASLETFFKTGSEELAPTEESDVEIMTESQESAPEAIETAENPNLISIERDGTRLVLDKESGTGMMQFELSEGNTSEFFFRQGEDGVWRSKDLNGNEMRLVIDEESGTVKFEVGDGMISMQSSPDNMSVRFDSDSQKGSGDGIQTSANLWFDKDGSLNLFHYRDSQDNSMTLNDQGNAFVRMGDKVITQ